MTYIKTRKEGYDVAKQLVAFAMRAVLDTIDKNYAITRYVKQCEGMAIPVVSTLEVVVCCKDFAGFLQSTRKSKRDLFTHHFVDRSIECANGTQTWNYVSRTMIEDFDWLHEWNLVDDDLDYIAETLERVELC